MSIRDVEVESLADFDALVGGTGSLNGWFVSSLDLRERTEPLLRVDPRGAVFLGCRFAEQPVDVVQRLRAGGALIFPQLPDVPFDPYRPLLYSAEELYGVGEQGRRPPYDACPDSTIYAWTGSPEGRSLFGDLAATLHDHSVDGALDDVTEQLDPRRVVGIMGGHALTRRDPAYAATARLGLGLTRAGRTVLTGGGPGAMEAGNLGAYLSTFDDALPAALASLAAAPDYVDGVEAWAASAFAVRARWVPERAGASLSIPTWFYGHEPGNFTAGETLKDQATGATVATLTSVRVCMSGVLNTTYPTTPQVRFVPPGAHVDVSRVTIKADDESDPYLDYFNRPDALLVAGAASVNVDGLNILSGYYSGLVLKSCLRWYGTVKVANLPDHALEVADSATKFTAGGRPVEQGYGYGVRTLGHCGNGRLNIIAYKVRHAFTTNGVGRAWNLNDLTGSTSGATSLCTSYLDAGPGARDFKITGEAVNTYGTAWDTHEGAEDGEFFDCDTIYPASAGRAITSPDGYMLRGFNLTVTGGRVIGARYAVNNQAGPIPTDLRYTNLVHGLVGDKLQANGIAENADDYDESLARMVYLDNDLRVDPTYKTAYTGQSTFLLYRGNRTLIGNRGTSGYAMYRFQGAVGSDGSNATGHALVSVPVMDFTGSTATRPFNFEQTWAEVYINAPHIRADFVSSIARPSAWFYNQNGDSVVKYRGLSSSKVSGSAVDPTAVPVITTGSPTFTSMDPVPAASSALGLGFVNPPGGTSRVLNPFVRAVASGIPTTTGGATGAVTHVYPCPIKGGGTAAFSIRVITAQSGGATTFKIGYYADAGGIPNLAAGIVQEWTIDLTTVAAGAYVDLTPTFPPGEGMWWPASYYLATSTPTAAAALMCVSGIWENLPYDSAQASPGTTPGFAFRWTGLTAAASWPTAWSGWTTETGAKAPAIYLKGS